MSSDPSDGIDRWSSVLDSFVVLFAVIIIVPLILNGPTVRRAMLYV